MVKEFKIPKLDRRYQCPNPKGLFFDDRFKSVMVESVFLHYTGRQMVTIRDEYWNEHKKGFEVEEINLSSFWENFKLIRKSNKS